MQDIVTAAGSMLSSPYTSALSQYEAADSLYFAKKVGSSASLVNLLA